LGQRILNFIILFTDAIADVTKYMRAEIANYVTNATVGASAVSAALLERRPGGGVAHRLHQQPLAKQAAGLTLHGGTRR
jgi:hypothetical protein